MIIKKISDECVKVLIESEDINRYNIPYYKLSSTDEESVEFIYRLLFLIFEQTGISFLETAISVEATPACAGNFFLTITRKEESEGMFLRKEGETQSDMFLFALEDLSDLAGVKRVMEEHGRFIPERCSLYKMAERYYVIFDFSVKQTQNEAFEIFLRQLDEYLLPLRATPESEGYLCERGKIICPALFSKQ